MRTRKASMFIGLIFIGLLAVLTLPSLSQLALAAPLPQVNTPAPTPVPDDLKSVQVTISWDGAADPDPRVFLRLMRNLTGGIPEPALSAGNDLEVKAGTTKLTWQVVDLNAPDGKYYHFSVIEVNQNGTPYTPPDSALDNGKTVSETYTVQTVTDVTASKVWVNGSKVRKPVYFQLYRKVSGGNEETVGSPALLNGVVDSPCPAEPAPCERTAWKLTWKDLAYLNPDNLLYIYTIKESTEATLPFTEKAVTNFKLTYSADGLTATNTYVIPLKEVSATKIWVNGAQSRPAIWFQLQRNTVVNPTFTVDPDQEPIQLPNPVNNKATATWDKVESTDIEGNPYTFQVVEGFWNPTTSQFTNGVPVDYKKTEDGLTVRNEYVIPKINVTGTKIWRGGNTTSRPYIYLQLYRNGVADGPSQLLAGSQTSYTWINKDKTDINGNVYNYTLDEVTVPSYYSKSLSGMTVTNTYVGTMPYTGDDHKLIIYLSMAALMLLGFGLYMHYSARQRKNNQV